MQAPNRVLYSMWQNITKITMGKYGCMQNPHYDHYLTVISQANFLKIFLVM